MAGGFGRVTNVSYPDTTSEDAGWITRSSFAAFCAQTLAAELLSTNHAALMTAILCAVAVFSRLTTRPVLFMVGEKDGATPAAMRTLCEKLPGSRFVELAGAGHISNMDRPAEFTAAVRAFLGVA